MRLTFVLGLGMLCPRPTIALDSVTAQCWCEASVFSEACFHPKNRTVSVSTGTQPFATVIVVAAWQNPQGGGVLALVENATDLSISHCTFSSVFWSSVKSYSQASRLPPKNCSLDVLNDLLKTSVHKSHFRVSVLISDSAL